MRTPCDIVRCCLVANWPSPLHLVPRGCVHWTRGCGRRHWETRRWKSMSRRLESSEGEKLRETLD